MKVPVETFNKDQRYWYAQIMCKAVLADKLIETDEMDFLLKPFYYLEAEQKEELKLALKEKNIPDDVLAAPKGIETNVLGTILTEIALLVVSDGKLEDKEKEFLRKVLKSFHFPDNVVEPFMKWVKQAHKTEDDRRKFVAEAAWKFQIEKDKKK